ncbi:hypothetical protein ABBQ32_008510 [Trebouxia sp. C0010 RCD-2024]
MLNGRQCSGASTTGRTIQEFGDHAAFRSHHHPSRLPRPSLFKPAAKVCPKPCQPCNLSRRQKLSLQASPSSRRHCQRSRHSPITACAATSAQIEPNHGRLPSLLRNIRTAVVLAAVFSIWCCISANTQPSSAFLSVTSALTSAGAPPAVAQGAVRSGYAGLAAGCLHSLAGVDHLAALTPFTIGRSHTAASLLGALWGFGHSTGQLIMGLVMIVLKDRFQHIVPTLNKLGNLTVGLTLMLIGVLGILESRQHNQEVAQHLQPVTAEGPVIQGISQKPPEKSGLRHSLGIFATGVVYGCNPDALFCVIPAITLPTKLAAATYTAMFVLGTVGAMGGYTAFIGAVSRGASEAVNSRLATFASVVALVVGAGVLLSGWGVALPFSFSLM